MMAASTSTSASAAVPACEDPFTGTTNPLVGVDLTGFEATSITIASRMERGVNVVEADEVVVRKLVPNPPVSNEHLRLLESGESIWNIRIHPVHFNNILGGFVPDKEQESDKDKREKGKKRKKRRKQKK